VEGNPAHFEAAGTRLGFRVEAETGDSLSLVWQGVRFPAFLCLGIAAALLLLSVPIAMAIHQRGFTGPAGSLWYFPVMNLILLGVSCYLLSLKRTIVIDGKARQIALQRRSLFRRSMLRAGFDEIVSVRFGIDPVSGGLAVASAAPNESYPVPSLRLVLKTGETVLLDRGSNKRLKIIGEQMRRFLTIPLETAEAPLQ
jgi:hypothetical protein